MFNIGDKVKVVGCSPLTKREELGITGYILYRVHDRFGEICYEIKGVSSEKYFYDEELELVGGNTATKPSHYTQGEYEVIDVIEDWGLDKSFCLANAIKYIARAEHKGKFKEDLKKAIYYLQRERLIRNNIEGLSSLFYKERLNV